MNRTVKFAMGFVFTLLAVAAAGQECSLNSLKGTYGFIAPGAIVVQLPGYPPPPLLGVTSGIITYDGAGNHWGESTLNLDAFGSGTDTFTGTQTVNPDCTFSGQHVSSSDGSTTNFEGTITGSGTSQEIHFVVTDPGFVAYGKAYKIPSGGCSLSTLKGPYAFSGQGTVTADSPPSLVASVGIVTYDGKGNLVGTATTAWKGTTGRDTFTGKYAVDANCTASLEITSSVFGVIHKLGRITREGQSQEVDLIITDPGFVFAEANMKQ